MGKKKSEVGASSPPQNPPALVRSDGKPEIFVPRTDGSYEISPGILLRPHGNGEWEVTDTRDPAVMADAAKLDPTMTMIGGFEQMAKTTPLKVNDKGVKPGEVVILRPGDQVLCGMGIWQFHLPGPKAWDGEVAKLPPAAGKALVRRFSEANSLLELKARVQQSGVVGSDKVGGEIDACWEGKAPVSTLPEVLQQPVLQLMAAESREMARSLPKGYAPTLDPAVYRGGVDPQEKNFHTMRAAVNFDRAFQAATTFDELRVAIETTDLDNPEGLYKDVLLERLKRFEKGEIGIQDIPKGLGLRQKVRDLWEAKNLRQMEGKFEAGGPPDPAALAAVEGMDSRAFQIYAELGRIGPVKGSAKTYSVPELRELVYEVLERGKPLKQLPENKGVRAMVENFMRRALADAKDALKSDLDFKKNFFTGEDFKDRNFDKQGKDPAYVESLEAKYRFIRMYLNQKAGKPMLGDPSPREMELLSRFAKTMTDGRTFNKYSEFQTLIRGELSRFTPKIQAALRNADPETRDLVIQAFFGVSRHRQMSDTGQALRIAKFLGEIGYHREIGVTADTTGGTFKVNLTLGDVAHVAPEDPHLIFLMHTHPPDYTAGGGGDMGINQTIALGQAIAKKSTLNVLFSSTDVRIYLRQAQDMYSASKYSKTDVSAVYDKQNRVFRNWVQHTEGLSQAEVVLDADGKVKAVHIRYGLYPQALQMRQFFKMAGGKMLVQGEHNYQARKLEGLSAEFGVPVTVEEVDPAQIEAQLPFGKK